ncbi:hypothetical protein [Pseudomonas sp. Root562]|uniref:hypothetical protein n=1 Tax=Pseudomonas sp. Root562 TaxID=1736561 RepID=UPI00070253BE|nr:hypothetical protein [Pseudomonas sp. Root562]KQZ81537.1 hypothetical protein ASD60_10140 [Pseudomonas sp. Root562]
MKYLALSFLILVNTAAAQCPVPPANVPSEAAKQLAISKLGQFLKCEANDPLNDQSPCNTFASRGLESIYGVNDFKSNGTSHQSANQMWDTVNAPGSKWSNLGKVFDEQNNLCAQSAANAGWPVIALLKAAGHGHVALVIPGEPQQSGSWGMLVANSASFLLNAPASAYLNKPLSNAFGAANAQNAVFFYRKP